jgi:GTPase SAR1 family protein
VHYIIKSIQLDSDAHYPVVVYGESGSGKTSVVASIVTNARERIQHPNLVMIYRFIGITPASSVIIYCFHNPHYLLFLMSFIFSRYATSIGKHLQTVVHMLRQSGTTPPTPSQVSPTGGKS